jgi:hypothetical protein
LEESGDLLKKLFKAFIFTPPESGTPLVGVIRNNPVRLKLMGGVNRKSMNGGNPLDDLKVLLRHAQSITTKANIRKGFLLLFYLFISHFFVDLFPLYAKERYSVTR